MLSFITNLFVNLCILISLIFIYMQLRGKFNFAEHASRRTILADGLTSGILGVLLMHFSIQVTAETIVDLRFVPVMLMVIFVGIPQGIIGAVIIIAGRFMFGLNPSSIAAAVLMITIILGYIILNRLFDRYRAHSGSYTKGLIMTLFSNLVFAVIISFLLQDIEILKSLIPSYWFVSFAGGITAIFFVEYIQRTQLLLEKYEQESTTDFLTGLNNVRQFDTLWNTMITTATQKDERLSLLIIDIDHFKQVNDTYGHQVGDQVLAELGRILKNTSRSFDIVSRNGGEEFSVILPDCHQEQAVAIAERIRTKVETHRFKVSSKDTINITISIGVATYPETVADTSQIFSIADDCLYKAKRTGRNRVCSC